MTQNPSDNRITYFATSDFRGQDVPFGIRRRDRRFHIYILGRSGTGKSSLLQTLIQQDIEAGEGLILLDPHGDLVAKALQSIPPHRSNDLIYFDPLHTNLSFNPLGYVPYQFRSLAAAGLVSAFKAIWAESWGPRLEHILHNAVLALLSHEGSTLADVLRLLEDGQFRKRVVAGVLNPQLKNFWLYEYDCYPARFRLEAIAPIQNKVGAFLTNPVLNRLVTSEGEQVRLRRVMDEGKILLVNLAKGRIGDDASSLLGALLLSRTMLASTSRVNLPEESRRDFYVYADEVHTYATGSLAGMLSELRKFRTSLILSHQHLSQLPAEVREAILANAGTLISFRIGAKDAETLAPEFYPQFFATDLVSLPNYHIYLKLMIDGAVSKPFSARTLPPGQ